VKPHLDFKHAGSLGDEGRHRMEFDTSSVAHLMSVLTDLYADPAMAVIREYSTNALDAQVAAGYKGPIEVTAPSPLLPIFTVTDHGVGMSHETIANQFSKYGWSSKRDSDAVVGMLGLGCKSGLSYTGQFTIVSTREGETCTVLVTREEDGAGAVQIVDVASTGFPNGTTVSIPVADVDSFIGKMDLFYKYWEPGTVVVNGEPVPSVFDNGRFRIDPDVKVFFATTNRRSESSIVVMGNVPYPVPPAFELNAITGRGDCGWKEQASPHLRYIARVPIGTVDFTPSREALHLTKRTIETLNDIGTFIGQRLIRACAARVESCENWWSAIDLMTEFDRFFNYRAPAFRRQITFRGQPIPVLGGTHDSFITLLQGARGELSVGWRNDFSANIYNPGASDFHVTHHKAGRVDITIKTLLLGYLAKHGIRLADARIYLHKGELPYYLDCKANGDPLRVVTFDELKAEFTTPGAMKSKGSPLTYEYVTVESHARQKSKVFPDDVIAYMTISEWKENGEEIRKFLHSYAELKRASAISRSGESLGKLLELSPTQLRAIYDAVDDKDFNPSIIVIGARQVRRFMRDHSTVPAFDEWIAAQKDDLAKLVPEPLSRTLFELEDVRYRSSISMSFIREVKFTDILDPDLREVCRKLRLANLSVGSRLANTVTAFYERLVRMCKIFKAEVPKLPDRPLRVPTHSTEEYEMEKRYPIMRFGLANGLLLEAVNALYLTRQGLHLHPATY
jgi:hypothetical protein